MVIKVFFNGDYEFLCAAYGITGANGKDYLECLFFIICKTFKPLKIKKES